MRSHRMLKSEVLLPTCRELTGGFCDTFTPKVSMQRLIVALTLTSVFIKLLWLAGLDPRIYLKQTSTVGGGFLGSKDSKKPKGFRRLLSKLSQNEHIQVENI